MLRRNLTIVTCYKCGAMRHNKRSCKGKRDDDKNISKGGDKNKEKTCATEVGNKNNTKGGNKKKT